MCHPMGTNSVDYSRGETLILLPSCVTDMWYQSLNEAFSLSLFSSIKATFSMQKDNYLENMTDLSCSSVTFTDWMDMKEVYLWANPGNNSCSLLLGLAQRVNSGCMKAKGMDLQATSPNLSTPGPPVPWRGEAPSGHLWSSQVFSPVFQCDTGGGVCSRLSQAPMIVIEFHGNHFSGKV